MLKDSEEDDIERKLRLKGQMIYMDNWRFVENSSFIRKLFFMKFYLTQAYNVSRNPCHAEAFIPRINRSLHQRFINARFQQVTRVTLSLLISVINKHVVAEIKKN